MASYVVLERRPVAGSRPDTVFVRDEFSFLALFFPLVWLLWHRLWFAALMLLLVSAAIGITGQYVAPGLAMAVAGIAVSLHVALEGPAWRMARHWRDGFVEAGTVVARNLDDAEIRWFTGRGKPADIPAAGPARRLAGSQSNSRQPEGDVLFGFGEEPAR
ncbi:DUF2628 domain-containing protein [Oricola thermophila]|uniref:DUF2628 domain-containing protein n=1 Tax=Oricola thermophila TaxID=2742145 RepID=A0A6N1VFW0_9HYPH|nr:DUF2628 domain-containing protein [Oricola thermophila]QKV19816.1 DUF2628 domain-containing protein [Oricola thermophila]